MIRRIQLSDSPHSRFLGEPTFAARSVQMTPVHKPTFGLRSAPAQDPAALQATLLRLREGGC